MTAAGVLFYATETKRFLFLLRNNTRTRGTWGMPGGKLNPEENIIEGLKRELEEELGTIPEVIKYIPLEKFTSIDEQFVYNSFIFLVANEFLPKLNNEHSGYAWTSLERYPKPLHPGLWNSLNISVIKEKIKFIQNLN